MRQSSASHGAALLALVLILCLVPALTGCGQSQPTFISFTGKGSASAKSMKTIVDKLKKKYKGQVIFVDVNLDDPASKAEIKKYSVSMNPTFIILNSDGQVKETFMGAAQEDMLAMSLESFIPQKANQAGKTSSPASTPAPSSSPAQQTVPASPAPQSVPAQTTP